MWPWWWTLINLPYIFVSSILLLVVNQELEGVAHMVALVFQIVLYLYVLLLVVKKLFQNRGD